MSGAGLTDIHAHPAMNAFLWDRDLRRHYGTGGGAFNPLASLSDFPMLARGGVRVLWSALHVPEKELLSVLPIRLLARTTSGGRMLLERDAWECLLAMHAEMERQVARADARYVVVRSNAELDAAVAADRVAIVHTVEGGHVLGAGLEAGDVDGRVARVDALSSLGVASLTLAHLFPNELAGHADGIPASPFRRLLPSAQVDLSRGLSSVGRAVVERMVSHGMVAALGLEHVLEHVLRDDDVQRRVGERQRGHVLAAEAEPRVARLDVRPEVRCVVARALLGQPARARALGRRLVDAQRAPVRHDALQDAHQRPLPRDRPALQALVPVPQPVAHRDEHHRPLAHRALPQPRVAGHRPPPVRPPRALPVDRPNRLRHRAPNLRRRGRPPPPDPLVLVIVLHDAAVCPRTAARRARPPERRRPRLGGAF